MTDWEDLSDEQKDKIERYFRLFAKSSSEILQDYNNNKKNLTELTKYSISDLVSMLKSPATEQNQKRIRKLSQFLYQVSSHYKILCNYYANILLCRYTVVPANISSILSGEADKESYKIAYATAVDQVEKYDLDKTCKRIMRIAVRDGAFYGLCYESDGSFYIDQFDPDYAQITSIVDGVLKFSINLDYYTSVKRNFKLAQAPKDVQKAYLAYKGDTERGIQGDSKQQYYEPKDGICIMADDSDPSIVLPLFTGLLKDIFDIEDYRLIKKADEENSNYKAVSMQIETDELGIPKMPEPLIKKYYNQVLNNVPDGIGVIASPFKVDLLSLNSGRNSDTRELSDAESQFWFDSGTSPLLFGSSKATTSGSLELSVKPNEEIGFNILSQIEKYFNYKLRSLDKNIIFKIKFNHISIFNEKEKMDADFKAAQYGVAGAKLKVASDIGLTPSDIIGMTYLENTILNVGTDMFNRPLISSNTLSGGDVSNEGGRPTAEEKGETLTDNGEKGREYE